MAQSNHPTPDSGWAVPGGLSPIVKEELYRVLDEENIQEADLSGKAPYLADKIRDTFEKVSGEKLTPDHQEAFQALVSRESQEWLSRRPHV
ncbi:hypothetical protein [Hymenobacter weizhouensis]|uniref:hypothetical protein n=1 Tax=Hymenobacter sp. YIM 151500-1 TaxID=2987689 RepID=UPI002227ED59|nr:hypothetical protein [Hymenobacter sp. YIM 151500-1]UYZ62704.1 hypothetical protein OIS53_17100 [Hymenobacter sp. YIM 151500-1]